MKDYYCILEVHPEASAAAIDRAYKSLVRRYHPDALPPAQRRWATLRMQELNEARDVLAEPARRARYDRRRRLEFWRLFWREGLAGLSRRRGW